MSWLARLDARSNEWPAAARWPYLSLKWLLIAMGTYLIVGLAFVELSEKRVGLGTGVVVTVLLGTIKGVTMAAKRHR
jgi:hypothetical protein